MTDKVGNERAPWWRCEGLWSLEILALTTLAFARPVLSLLGGAPMVFRAHQATPLTTTVWLFLLVVAPPLLVTAVGLSGRSLDRPVRRHFPRLGGTRWGLHLALVGGLAGLVAWRFMVERPDLGPSSLVALLVGVVAAGTVGFVRWWKRSQELAATFLRWTAVAAVVFVGQFLLSEAGQQVYRTSRSVDTDAAAAVADEAGDDVPPVVVVVLDELPTATLLDDEGGIDADRFPNLARFSDQSTWYRNHTTNALSTYDALPTLITGTYLPAGHNAWNLDPNLFTLVGETHELSVHEEITDMCAPSYCAPEPWNESVGGLVSDSRWVWDEATLPLELYLGALPGLNEHRFEEAEDRIDRLDLEGGDRPPFVFHHIVLPHAPWYLTPDGSAYEPVPSRGELMNGWTGDPGLMRTSQQRHLLQAQASDRLLGRMFDRLEEAGIFDDAIVVVTADHGHGFVEAAGRRSASEGSLHQTLWSPLLIRAPGQEDEQIVDHNVQLVDVLPTIAELMGVELPWEIDGRPADPDEAQRGPGITFTYESTSDFEATRDGLVELDGSEYFTRLLEEGRLWPGTGPEAAWQRTEHHELLRREVDDLPSGPPVVGTVEVVAPETWDPGAEPQPVVVSTETDLEAGEVVAFAVDGTVAGLTEVVADEPNLAEVLLLPELLGEGAELEAFLVEGPVGEETLHPLS